MAVMKATVKNGEYWLVNLVISLTMIVCFVTGLMYANVMAPEMVPLVLGAAVNNLLDSLCVGRIVLALIMGMQGV